MPDWFKYGELPAMAGKSNTKPTPYAFSFPHSSPESPESTGQYDVGEVLRSMTPDGMQIGVRGVGVNQRMNLGKGLYAEPGASLVNVGGSQGGQKLFNVNIPTLNAGLGYDFSNNKGSLKLQGNNLLGKKS